MKKIRNLVYKIIKHYSIDNFKEIGNLLFTFFEGKTTAGTIPEGQINKHILVKLSGDFLPIGSLVTQFLGGKWTAESIVAECSVRNKPRTYIQALTDPNGNRSSNTNDLNSLSWFAQIAANAHDRNRESRNTRGASYANHQHRRVMIPA